MNKSSNKSVPFEVYDSIDDFNSDLDLINAKITLMMLPKDFLHYIPAEPRKCYE